MAIDSFFIGVPLRTSRPKEDALLKTGNLDLKNVFFLCFEVRKDKVRIIVQAVDNIRFLIGVC